MTTTKINNITGAILAGGASRRFGSNKALAEINGQTIIARIAAVMQKIFSRTLLITNTPAAYQFLRLPMHGDIFTNSGPLAGIHSALTASQGPIFVCACDMPFVSAPLIRYLCARLGDYDIVLPVSKHGPEPLSAVYAPSALAVINHNLEVGELRIGKAIEQLRARRIATAEILTMVADLRCFLNINRPEDMPK